MSTDNLVQILLDHCLAKPGAYVDFPFGEIPVCVKVGGRLFAQVYPKEEGRKITLNCDVMSGEFFRSLHPGVIVRGYHCPPQLARGYHCPPQLAPYFNTVYLNGSVPETELKMMIDHSYTTVFKKLTRKAQRKISDANSK